MKRLQQIASANRRAIYALGLLLSVVALVVFSPIADVTDNHTNDPHPDQTAYQPNEEYSLSEDTSPGFEDFVTLPAVLDEDCELAGADYQEVFDCADDDTDDEEDRYGCQKEQDSDDEAVCKGDDGDYQAEHESDYNEDDSSECGSVGYEDDCAQETDNTKESTDELCVDESCDHMLQPVLPIGVMPLGTGPTRNIRRRIFDTASSESLTRASLQDALLNLNRSVVSVTAHPSYSGEVYVSAVPNLYPVGTYTITIPPGSAPDGLTHPHSEFSHQLYFWPPMSEWAHGTLGSSHVTNVGGNLVFTEWPNTITLNAVVVHYQRSRIDIIHIAVAEDGSRTVVHDTDLQLQLPPHEPAGRIDNTAAWVRANPGCTTLAGSDVRQFMAAFSVKMPPNISQIAFENPPHGLSQIVGVRMFDTADAKQALQPHSSNVLEYAFTDEAVRFVAGPHRIPITLEVLWGTAETELPPIVRSDSFPVSINHGWLAAPTNPANAAGLPSSEVRHTAPNAQVMINLPDLGANFVRLEPIVTGVSAVVTDSHVEFTMPQNPVSIDITWERLVRVEVTHVYYESGEPTDLPVTYEYVQMNTTQKVLLTPPHDGYIVRDVENVPSYFVKGKQLELTIDQSGDDIEAVVAWDGGITVNQEYVLTPASFATAHPAFDIAVSQNIARIRPIRYDTSQYPVVNRSCYSRYRWHPVSVTQGLDITWEDGWDFFTFEIPEDGIAEVTIMWNRLVEVHIKHLRFHNDYYPQEIREIREVPNPGHTGTPAQRVWLEMNPQGTSIEEASIFRGTAGKLTPPYPGFGLLSTGFDIYRGEHFLDGNTHPGILFSPPNNGWHGTHHLSDAFWIAPDDTGEDLVVLLNWGPAAVAVYHMMARAPSNPINNVLPADLPFTWEGDPAHHFLPGHSSIGYAFYAGDEVRIIPGTPSGENGRFFWTPRTTSWGTPAQAVFAECSNAPPPSNAVHLTAEENHFSFTMADHNVWVWIHWHRRVDVRTAHVTIDGGQIPFEHVSTPPQYARMNFGGWLVQHEGWSQDGSFVAEVATSLDAAPPGWRIADVLVTPGTTNDYVLFVGDVGHSNTAQISCEDVSLVRLTPNMTGDDIVVTFVWEYVVPTSHDITIRQIYRQVPESTEFITDHPGFTINRGEVHVTNIANRTENTITVDVLHETVTIMPGCADARGDIAGRYVRRVLPNTPGVEVAHNPDGSFSFKNTQDADITIEWERRVAIEFEHAWYAEDLPPESRMITEDEWPFLSSNSRIMASMNPRTPTAADYEAPCIQWFITSALSELAPNNTDLLGLLTPPREGFTVVKSSGEAQAAYSAMLCDADGMVHGYRIGPGPGGHDIVRRLYWGAADDGAEPPPVTIPEVITPSKPGIDPDEDGEDEEERPDDEPGEVGPNIRMPIVHMPNIEVVIPPKNGGMGENGGDRDDPHPREWTRRIPEGGGRDTNGIDWAVTADGPAVVAVPPTLLTVPMADQSGVTSIAVFSTSGNSTHYTSWGLTQGDDLVAVYVGSYVVDEDQKLTFIPNLDIPLGYLAFWGGSCPKTMPRWTWGVLAGMLIPWFFAMWSRRSLMVKFVTDEHEDPIVEKYTKGDVVSVPCDVAASGEFKGWYQDPGCTPEKKWNFSRKLDKSITLYGSRK